MCWEGPVNAVEMSKRVEALKLWWNSSPYHQTFPLPWYTSSSLSFGLVEHCWLKKKKNDDKIKKISKKSNQRQQQTLPIASLPIASRRTCTARTRGTSRSRFSDNRYPCLVPYTCKYISSLFLHREPDRWFGCQFHLLLRFGHAWKLPSGLRDTVLLLPGVLMLEQVYRWHGIGCKLSHRLKVINVFVKSWEDV